MAVLALVASALQGCSAIDHTRLIEGVVWQPDQNTLNPRGDWDRLGAHELLIQWLAADGLSLLNGTSVPTMANLPDLSQIAAQPWARRTIVGLATNRSEAEGRMNIPRLVEQSIKLAESPNPLTVSGWYFPIELDPTWKKPEVLHSGLEKLPRPLWISVYDNANLGPDALVKQIRLSVPDDVGLFFQDGVGVYSRTPAIALDYLEALTVAFGKRRVRVIVEAFRTTSQGFRSATPCELMSQIKMYRGFKIYLFDGPHYLTPNLVDDLYKDSRRHDNLRSC